MWVAAVLVLTAGLVAGTALLFADPGGGRGQAAARLHTPGPRFVLVQRTPERDLMLLVAARDPSDRVTLAAFDRPLVLGNVQTSPDGARVAYVLLGRPGVPDGLAGLWIRSSSPGGAAIRASVQPDDLSRLAWSVDGSALVVRSGTELVRVDAATGAATQLVGQEGALGIYPIGAGRGGWPVVYATIDGHGTDAWRLDGQAATATLVAHLSDGIARDFSLSPGGRRMAYLAPEHDSAGEVMYVARELRFDGTALAAASSVEGARGAVRPVWRPDGTLTVGRVGHGAVGVAVAGAQSTSGTQAHDRPEGIEAPLGWSQDGSTLAVQAFARDNPNDPGPADLRLLGQNGAPATVGGSGVLEFGGWAGGGR